MWIQYIHVTIASQKLFPCQIIFDRQSWSAASFGRLFVCAHCAVLLWLRKYFTKFVSILGFGYVSRIHECVGFVLLLFEPYTCSIKRYWIQYQTYAIIKLFDCECHLNELVDFLVWGPWCVDTRHIYLMLNGRLCTGARIT